MARYKLINNNPRFLPVDLSRQLLPGTFEFALNHLLDHEIDLLKGFELIALALAVGGVAWGLFVHRLSEA